MTGLSFHRYQFNFTLDTPLHLDFYAGSLLRGVFGHALRKVSCMTKLKVCPECPLYRTCPYTTVFEMPPPLNHHLQAFSQIPNPYLLEPPPLGKKTYPAGDTLSFSMVLIGPALAQLPLIIFAWQQAFALGVGKYQSTARLKTVALVDAHNRQHIIYDPQTQPSVQAHAPAQPQELAQQASVTLTFQTPLHIQKQGKVLADNMSAKDFLMALIRRHYLLHEFYGHDYQAPPFSALAAHAQTIHSQTQFQWCRWQRYSNRQQQKMRFDGVLGQISLSGDLQPFLPMLQAGQWLHIGNKTTFGMGRYQIHQQICQNGQPADNLV
ncbi:MAG: CRISPR system precrRNA processing endoribonuclease RAMP protein Cas6 [Methylovulum sp.]|uniref:CRISPR system precrRNA processing endoribonuclease RAMP protein Cas6 n=1 Tax=Methylovulum sp. TaxID=1916980 RepID=UPI002639FB7A|nr:CRISPR system precrRNA processing endoribonuclease RAMP protein Cas6 [Methylovulum sp.]MDD2725263.1 CRISPR system precrRNA processing endoribonuclease RAMP protein Cas6 [Methylovulum sp.]